MFEYLTGFFQTLWYVVLCDLFFGIFAKRREKSPQIYTIIIVLTVINFCTTIFANRFIPLKEVCVVICTSFAFWTIYRMKYYKSLVVALLYQSVCLAIEYITIVFMQSSFKIKIDTTAISITNSLLGLLCQIVIFLIIIIIRKRLSIKVRESLTEAEWAIFSIFPLFTIFTVILLIVKSDTIKNSEQENILLIIASGLLVLNFVIYFLLNMIVKREEELAESRLFKEQIKNEIEMYNSISENLERQKRKIHEFNNHMTCIMSLARQGEFDRLSKYLNNMQSEIMQSSDYLDTNNVLINAILNSKYAEGREKGITFAFKVNDLSKISLSDEDIVIILSNLINNAFEACEKCEKKIIQMKILLEPDKLIISLINTKSGKVISEGGRLLTTKKEDIEFHGIGIDNVKEAVQRNNGECIIKHDDERFQFSIIIPVSEDEV